MVPADPDSIGSSRRRPLTDRPAWWAWWPWFLGLATGLAVLGPALGPGALFNLDLAVAARVPFPDSLLGLGPELPRRGPFYALLSVASLVDAGALAWKLLAVAAVALAFVGAVRRTDGLPAIARIGAGWVYALSPFLLTRIGIGHLGLVLAMALLPHALETLVRPADDLGRTFLWSVALSVTGVYGVLLALPLLVAGLIGERLRRWVRVGAVVAVGQTWWLLSSIVVLAQGSSVADGSAFPPSSYGPGGHLRVLGGHGFWQPAYQVGVLQGWVVPVAAIVLVAFAVAGQRGLPPAWRRPVLVGAVVGLVLTLAPVVPGLDAAHEWLTTATPLGGPIRESQRLLALYVLWVALASAHGADRLARRLASGAGPPVMPVWLVPGLLALVLGVRGLWGIGGQLDPIDLPDEWHAAVAAVDADPGTVLALPWTEFYDLPVADDRRVVNPVPYVFGGDVIVAVDPKFEGSVAGEVQESVDPRVATADAVVADLEAGVAVAADLASLGVRWVVLVVAADEARYRSLDDDPDLAEVAAGPTLRLYENRRVPGAIIDGDESWSVDHLLPIVATAARDDAGTWSRPGGRWWLQGAASVSTSADGTAVLPGGSTLLWYWPGVVVVLADLGVVLAAAVTIRRRIARNGGKSR